MKLRLSACMIMVAGLSACSGWFVEPLQNNPPPTPFPSSTPIIYTATPLILPAPLTSTPVEPPVTVTQIQPTSTLTGVPGGPTSTLVFITDAPPAANVHAKILGCQDGFDVTHGMGKVTNSYVTISNLSSQVLPNVCATLRGLNEGRPHPDKTVCVASIPAGYQVTLKLTIDSAFNKDSPVQINVVSDNYLLIRVGQDSCQDMSLFPPNVNSLGKIIPIP